MDGILDLSVTLWGGLINPHILKPPNIFCQICMKMLPYACMSTLNTLSTLIFTIKYYVLKLYLIQYYARFRVHLERSKSVIFSKIASAAEKPTSSKLKNIF